MKIYTNKRFSDDNGTIDVWDQLNLLKIKRIYLIEDYKKDLIRGFHGSRKETKYICVIEGSALLCLVKTNDLDNPPERPSIKKVKLTAPTSQIYQILPKRFFGLKSLEDNTRILILSTMTFKQSKVNELRLPFDYWGGDAWD